jgi:hypothetical protein
MDATMVVCVHGVLDDAHVRVPVVSAARRR